MGTLPSFLNPVLEIKDPVKPEFTPSEFVLFFINFGKKRRLTFFQSASFTANLANESAIGQSSKGNNFGGVKANKHNTTKNDEWWQAPGHVAAGDAPICYYKAYKDPEAFGDWSLRVFMPKPPPEMQEPPLGEITANYRLAGYYFYRDDPRWFDAIIGAGYKGDVVKNDPKKRAGSFNRHKALTEYCMIMYLQDKLGGLKVDGVFGPKTKEKLEKTYPGLNWLEAASFLYQA